MGSVTGAGILSKSSLIIDAKLFFFAVFSVLSWVVMKLGESHSVTRYAPLRYVTIKASSVVEVITSSVRPLFVMLLVFQIIATFAVL